MRAAISGLALLQPAAVERMARDLGADLASGAWHRRYGGLMALDEYDHGYRLLIAPPG